MNALKKCCAARAVNLLRKFLSETFVENRSFMTQCCVLFPSFKQEDLQTVEDIVAVLEVRLEVPTDRLTSRSISFGVF